MTIRRIFDGTNLYRMLARNVLYIVTVIAITATAAVAQNPLKGTWLMISAKGIGPDGERFRLDSATTKEIKVITERHYILIAANKHGDSTTFNRSYAGNVQVDGDRYLEVPHYSSNTIFDGVTTDFKWKIVGDRFIQSGSFTRPDGKKIILEEMVFHRLKGPANEDGAVGVWNRISSTSQSGAANTNMFHVITPTHWMRIVYRNKRFDYAMGGPYRIIDGRNHIYVDVASIPMSAIGKVTVIDDVKGNQLQSAVEHVSPDGTKTNWVDVFERIE